MKNNKIPKSISNYNYRSLNLKNRNELKQIAKIYLSLPSLWVENYSFDEKEIEDTVKDLIQKHKSENLFCYIIKDQNKIISFIWAETIKSNPEILNIISLWTHEDYRKEGLATYLKEKLENLARKQISIKKIITTVSVKNTKMIELNKKLKYEISMYKMLKNYKANPS